MDQRARQVPSTADAVPSIRMGYLWWAAAAVALMIVAIESGDPWFLNFVHVIFGLLWTGIDLFMGFILGPILRRIELDARRQVIVRLVPRTLFLMPTLSAVAITSGWYLAEMGGYLALPAPEIWWLYGALAIAAVLTVQGMAVLLPVNIAVYLELRKDAPDAARIDRLMRTYVWIVAAQGVMQVLMIVIMSRFASGV